MNIVSKSLLGLTVVGLFLVCTAMLNFVLLNSKFSQLRISSQMSFIKMTQMPFGIILSSKIYIMIWHVKEDPNNYESCYPVSSLLLKFIAGR